MSYYRPRLSQQHIVRFKNNNMPASVAVRTAVPGLATVIGESGFEAQAGRIIVSGYSIVCFDIKFLGRHRWFDGVLFNLWPLANTEFRDSTQLNLLKIAARRLD